MAYANAGRARTQSKGLQKSRTSTLEGLRSHPSVQHKPSAAAEAAAAAAAATAAPPRDADSRGAATEGRRGVAREEGEVETVGRARRGGKTARGGG